MSVTDVLPGALSYVSGAGTGWTCSSTGSTAVDSDPTCDLAAPLAAGETRSVELIVTVTGDFSTSVINEAIVSSADQHVVVERAGRHCAGRHRAAPPARPTAPPRALPSTGASPLPTLRVACVLVVLGILLLGIGVRRRRVS